MKLNSKHLFSVLFVLALTSGLSLASDEAAPNYAEDTLTGDWGGLRSAAAKRGFQGDISLKIDSLRNRGALRDGTRTVSHFDIKLKMDLEKAIGWQGGSAMVNIIQDAGNGLNAQYVGSWMGVTNLEAPYPTTTRVFHAWLQQSLWDDRLAILAGIYPVDSEFQVLDSAGVFVKPEYGPSGEFALTRGPSIFNNAAFGVRTKLQSADKAVYAQWALMDGIPNDPRYPKRTRVRFDDRDGAFNMAEIGWLPESGNDKFNGHAKLAFGLWGYSIREDDQFDAANIDAGNIVGPARHRRQHGGYLLGERTVINMDEDRFLSAFARYAWTDGYSSPLRSALNLGLHVKGPFKSRPNDILGLAWSRAVTSVQWRAAQSVGGRATDRAEGAFELAYRYVVNPWFAIQPDFQYITNPGTLSDVPNSRIVGARFEFIL